MAMITGLSLETFSLYVPYSHYEQARELTDALFRETAEETDADDPEELMESEDD